MQTLIELMKDPSVVVRDTTAWTVGRICELLPQAAITDAYLAPLLQCLIEGLEAEPRVASNVCWVRSGLKPGGGAAQKMFKLLYFLLLVILIESYLFDLNLKLLYKSKFSLRTETGSYAIHL